MRLPTLGAPQKIDDPLAIRMIRGAVDPGVNYVDTAYPYHGGKSEVLVGKALGDGYREKIKLATKMPVRLAKESTDFDRLFNRAAQQAADRPGRSLPLPQVGKGTLGPSAPPWHPGMG
jgi:hypothetical protein